MRQLRFALFFILIGLSPTVLKSQSLLEKNAFVNRSKVFLSSYNYDSASYFINLVPTENQSPEFQLALMLVRAEILMAKEDWKAVEKIIVNLDRFSVEASIDDPELLGMVEARRAEYALTKNKLSEVEIHGKKAIDLLKEANKNTTFEQAKTLILLGYAKVHNKDGEGAKAYFLEGLNLLGEANQSNAETILSGYYGINRHHYYAYEDSLAEAALLTGLQMTKGVVHPNSKNLGRFYDKLGSINNSKNNIDAAKTYYKNAIAIRQFHYDEYHPAISAIYNNYGKMLYGNNELIEGIEYLTKSLTIDRKLFGPDHNYVAISLGNLGNAYKRLGNYEKAIECLNEALRIRELQFGKINYRYGQSLNNLALVYERMGDYQKSIELLTEVKAIWAATAKDKVYMQGFVERNIATTYNLMQDHDNAIKHFMIAQSCLMPNYKSQDFYKNPSIDELTDNFNVNTTFHLKASILLSRFRLRKEQKDLEMAINTCELLIANVDKINQSMASEFSKQEFVEAIYQSYETAILACYEMEKLTNNKEYLEKAFEFLEKSKALVLVANMKSDQIKKQAGLPSHLVKQEDSLKYKLAEQKSLIFKAENDITPISEEQLVALKSNQTNTMMAFEELKNKIKGEYNQYYELTYNNNPLPLAKVQQELLEDNEMLIEHFYGPSLLFTFFISKNNIQVESMSSTDWINENVIKLREVISHKSSNVKSFKAIAGQLYDSLFSASEHLEKYEKLVIITDGILNYLPFGILIQNKGGNNFNELNYLIKEHQIAYQYSVNIWSEYERIQRSDEALDMIAFAPDFNENPSQDGAGELLAYTKNDVVRGNLAPLTGAINELQNLANLIKGEMYSGSLASEEEFKANAKNYGIIHLATHAIINDEDPMQSKLIFSVDSNRIDEDGDLYSWELYNMKLNAKLAVLSACNTGFGKIQSGEGVMSLGRAFAYAGCPAVIMSLWPAQDDATANLMTYFYEGLAKNQHKDQALRAAKLKYLNETNGFMAHPFYWASFVAQGDARPIQLNQPRPYLWIYIVLAVILASGGFFYYKKFR